MRKNIFDVYEKLLVPYLSYDRISGWILWSIIEKKDKSVKINFIDQKNAYGDNDADITHLELVDFFERPKMQND